MADLRGFLCRLAAQPFCETNCALPLADWWLANHGSDPAAEYRGKDNAKHPAVARLVDGIAKRAGAQRTATPKPGDMAVVRLGNAHYGAIMAPSRRWAIKCNDGLLITGACRVVKAWGIECRS